MLIAVAFVPDGNATVAEFESASRNNAGAFWMWAVSTAIVWVGASLLWRSFRQPFWGMQGCMDFMQTARS